jgi:hypothetical protein
MYRADILDDYPEVEAPHERFLRFRHLKTGSKPVFLRSKPHPGHGGADKSLFLRFFQIFVCVLIERVDNHPTYLISDF